MSRYIRVDRGSGSRPGQLLQHASDSQRWLVRAFIGRNAKGKKEYASQVVRGGRREAEAALIQLLHAKGAGQLAPRSTIRLAELTEEWGRHKAREVAPRTIRQYMDSLARYVLPTLGHRKVCDLQLREIDALYGRMLVGDIPRSGGRPGTTGRPLSPGTVRLTHAALSQALSQAVRWGLIPSNPAMEATVPVHRPTEKEVLTADERAAWLRACRGSFYYALYALLVDTGLRPGEACALTWADVDLKNGMVRVRRNVTKSADGAPVFAEPKTKSGRRDVPLLDGLRATLREHREQQKEWGHDERAFVFTNQNGDMLRPWTLPVRDFRRTLRSAGISKPMTFYSLRHTFATLHTANGTSLKTVSVLLGHATIQQTADTYMHEDSSVTIEWMRRYEQMVRGVKRQDPQVGLN